MDSSSIVEEAEAAVSRGDLTQAIALFERAAAAEPNDPALWMKIAAMHRGTNNPQAALDAVHRALAIAPLEFTALLMRASLLERLKDPQANEAWGHALSTC